MFSMTSAPRIRNSIGRVLTTAALMLLSGVAYGASPRPNLVGATGCQSNNLKANQVAVQVKGVAIPFTAFGIIHRLETVPGVTKVDFSLTSGLAILTLSPQAKLTDTALLDAVRDASYTPGQIFWGKCNAMSVRQQKTSGTTKQKPNSEG